MKNSIKWLIAIILLTAIGGLIYDRCSDMVRTDVHDTIILERAESILQIDTVQLTLTKWKEKETKVIDTIEIKRDTILLREAKRYQDSLILDSGKVKLDVYLSGVDARLDSTKISAEIPTLTIEKTVEKTIYKDKTRHFFYGPTIGAGFGIINRKFDIYAGVSVGWRF